MIAHRVIFARCRHCRHCDVLLLSLLHAIDVVTSYAGYAKARRRYCRPRYERCYAACGAQRRRSARCGRAGAPWRGSGTAERQRAVTRRCAARAMLCCRLQSATARLPICRAQRRQRQLRDAHVMRHTLLSPSRFTRQQALRRCHDAVRA